MTGLGGHFLPFAIATLFATGPEPSGPDTVTLSLSAGPGIFADCDLAAELSQALHRQLPEVLLIPPDDPRRPADVAVELARSAEGVVHLQLRYQDQDAGLRRDFAQLTASCHDFAATVALIVDRFAADIAYAASQSNLPLPQEPDAPVILPRPPPFLAAGLAPTGRIGWGEATRNGGLSLWVRASVWHWLELGVWLTAYWPESRAVRGHDSRGAELSYGRLRVDSGTAMLALGARKDWLLGLAGSVLVGVEPIFVHPSGTGISNQRTQAHVSPVLGAQVAARWPQSTPLRAVLASWTMLELSPATYGIHGADAGSYSTSQHQIGMSLGLEGEIF